MANNRELSQFADFLNIDEGVNNNVGIATTVRISGGGGVYVGGIEVISPTGVWKGPGSGLIGAQGTAGAQGAQGTQGSQGFQGDIGSQGSQGAQGSQGFQGDIGSQGAQGAQGSQGAQGAQGTQGAQGAQGVSGTLGATGAQGDAGPQGAQGSPGSSVTGPPGPTGPQGVQGSGGGTGPTGAQGTAGAQGDIGAQGAQGSTGSGSESFTAGTLLFFAQPTAPTGWTKITSSGANDRTLRVVTGATGGNVGGTYSFSSIFVNRPVSGIATATVTVSSTTLAASQIPYHTHNYLDRYVTSVNGGSFSGPNNPASLTGVNLSDNTRTTDSGQSGTPAVGNGSHSHGTSTSTVFSANSMEFSVGYIDVILCSKN